MSSISDFYDNINTLLTTKFGATHKKLTNPYDVTDNDSKTLARSYGFKIVSGTNPKLLVDCRLTMSRSFEVILTKKNTGTERDITIRETAEKSILEDHVTLMKAVLLDQNLNETLAKLEYVGDNGVEFVQIELENFLVITATFTFNYVENSN